METRAVAGLPRSQALRRLDEEEARARNCLHPSTLPKLRDCLHAVLLHAYDRKLMEVCVGPPRLQHLPHRFTAVKVDRCIASRICRVQKVSHICSHVPTSLQFALKSGVNTNTFDILQNEKMHFTFFVGFFGVFRFWKILWFFFAVFCFVPFVSLSHGNF